MYAIHATEQRTTTDGYTSTHQVPTFYLHERTNGIVTSHHAERIARDILARDGSVFYIYAYRIETETR